MRIVIFPLSGHLLTSWNRVILWKLTVVSRVEVFSDSSDSKRFITMLYEIFDSALSQKGQLRTLTPYFINIYFNIIILFEVRISNYDFKTIVIWRLYFLRLQCLNTVFSMLFTYPSSARVLLSPEILYWDKF